MPRAILGLGAGGAARADQDANCQEGKTMALRTFVDSTGAEWDAFDVIPRPDERRQYDRRTPEQRRLDAEDRRENDRRLTVGGGSPLVSGVVEGWLCFEHGVDRRRLSPI